MKVKALERIKNEIERLTEERRKIDKRLEELSQQQIRLQQEELLKTAKKESLSFDEALDIIRAYGKKGEETI